jgi:hypothetical protein
VELVGLPSECSIAFKEWAAVCEALAAGRQAIILRKGGIHEGPGGFAPEHREFWLYPTNFHQAGESLTREAAPFIARAQAGPQESGVIRLQHLAVVQRAYELAIEEAALRLAGLHIWSDATVRQRFHYRRPGLFLLVVRVYSRERVTQVQESAEMAGCKSWVELPQALATGALAPVLSDEQFKAAAAAIEAGLASSERA